MTTPNSPNPPDHDPSGLDFARQIAPGVGSKPAKRRPRKRQKETSSGPLRDPEPLASALGDIIKTEGWERDLALQAVVGRWESIVGADVAAHSHPERLVGKILTIRADSTAWATSLRTMAATLVGRLNGELGDGEVTQVKILGPDAPSWRHGKRTVRGGRGPRDTYG